MRTVSELAELAGVTVRTLHHYDEIGLLSPSSRSASGYRLYDRDDLRRLQEILLWRTLGFGLEATRSILDDADHDRLDALVRQKALLEAQQREVSARITAVEIAIAEERGGPEMDEARMFDSMATGELAAEAEKRWGDTDAWTQSRARTAAMTEEDKRRVVEGGVEHAVRMAAAMGRGVAPGSAEAMDLAEEARLAIDRQFYDCSREMHAHLGEMYVEDPRFTTYYDRHAPGLAIWFRDAIRANAAR